MAKELVKNKRMLVFGLVCGMVLSVLVCSNSVEARRVRKDSYATEREAMVQWIISQGIGDPVVIEAMRKIPRHEFVPPEFIEYAYYDNPLSIGTYNGYKATISAPYIVAYMTEKLGLTKDKKVLEVGTGSGYQTAILAEIAKEVYTIEIIEPLHQSAQERLKNLGYTDIKFKLGNGYYGWQENAPYDAIIVTCAWEDVPPTLKNQLAIGGIMIIPIEHRFGSVRHHFFTVIKKVSEKKFEVSVDWKLPVGFVPGVVP